MAIDGLWLMMFLISRNFDCSVLRRRGGIIWGIDAAGVVPLTANKVELVSVFSLNDLKRWRSCVSPCQPGAIFRTDSRGFDSRNLSILYVLFEVVVMLPMVCVMVSKFVLMKGEESDLVQSLGFGT